MRLCFDPFAKLTLAREGPTSDMVFRIPQLIEHCSSIMTLEEGDLLLTGAHAFLALRASS